MSDDQLHALQEQRHREAMALELAALRADAERYRWIRDYCKRSWIVDGIEIQLLSPGCESSLLDDNVDAAMKGGH